MKKSILFVALITALSLPFSACAGIFSTSSSIEIESEYELITGDFTLSDCIELAEYKGVELVKTIYVAGDEYLDYYIESLNEPVEVTDEDATVQTGDTVDIAYEGTIDGEVFDGGSSDSYDLEIGSGIFIDGFEEGLIGLKVGEEIDLELQFPDDYWSSDYAGLPVTFHVVINSISRLGEQDDAWVSEYTDGEYSTMEEYRAYIEESLNADFVESAESTLYSDAWSQIYDASNFLALPEEYVIEGMDLYLTLVEAQAINYGYSSAVEYYEAFGSSEEDLDSDALSYGESYALSVVFSEAVLEAEGISLDGDEVNAVYEDMSDEYGMTIDELNEYYGAAQVYEYVIRTVAYEILVDSAEIVEETVEYSV